MSSNTLSSNTGHYVEAMLVVDRIRSSYFISAHEELRAADFKGYDRVAVTRALGSCWTRILDIVQRDVSRILATEEDHSLVILRWIADDMVSHHFFVTFLRQNADRRGNPSLEKFHELFTRVYRTISGTQTIGVFHARTV